jgi:hypothetical protein
MNNYGGGGLGASGMMVILAYLLNLKEDRKNAKYATEVESRTRPDNGSGQDSN